MSNKKFIEFRNKYPNFIYKSYNYKIDKNLEIEYDFEIQGLENFNPKLVIPKEYIKIIPNKEYLDYLVFQIGLIEVISYVKATCSKNIIIEASYISESQINFLKKLYYNGLGELLYVNGINISQDELFNITCSHEKITLPKINYNGVGNLICVGGGKDSCVSLELLKNEPNNSCFIINAKKPSLECAKIAGYKDEDIIKIDRILDKKIIELNKKGFINGHTPFSSVVAFISYLVAYLTGKENIILSNESSANESTVHGTNINHQYSKTYEFECDFRNYMRDNLDLNINYFSLLRGLSEYNIAKLFSKYKKFHPFFKSCNLGSKEKEWIWCCNCSKCLFIYIILSPFLNKEELTEIFGQDLYERQDLLDIFIEIIGYSNAKPFDCVGTYEEARYAVSQVIEKNNDKLPLLLQYYKDNYELELNGSLIEKYNNENNLNEYYNKIVKKEVDKYV